MKRTLTLCLTLFALLVACERYPGQQAEAPRDQPNTSIAENQEATTDDQLLDNPIPGTDTTLQEGEAATGPNAEGAADPVDPGVNATETQATGTETQAADTEVAEASEAPLPDVQNVSPDPVGVGSVETTPIDVFAVDTGGAETGGAETGGADIGGSETGGAALETASSGLETGGAETGGAETGGAGTAEGTESAQSGGAAETGGAETGGTDATATGSTATGSTATDDAATDNAADLERIGETSTALTEADTEQAVATIEAWQTRLETANNPDLATVSADLETLKTELQADSPDEGAVKTLLYTLGQETSRLALVAPQDVGDALNALGTTLSEAGEESALADAPVDVAGAMPGVAETGGAETGGAETGGASAETGGADMNLQTGTVDTETGGATPAATRTEATPGSSAETGGTVATLQTSPIAETGGAETVGAESGGAESGGAVRVGETGGSAVTGSETGGTETGGAETGGVSEVGTQENVTSSQAPEVAGGQLLASAQLKDAEGADVGVVNLVSSDAGISFEFGLVEGAALEAGEHGFHVHETGSCTPDFEAAGAHLNPDGSSHGLLSANGPHAGDLPNLVIPEDGAPTYVATTMRLTPEALFDADGSAVIIHAGPDDYVTDPGGNSGDRVACGVLEQVGQ